MQGLKFWAMIPSFHPNTDKKKYNDPPQRYLFIMFIGRPSYNRVTLGSLQYYHPCDEDFIYFTLGNPTMLVLKNIQRGNFLKKSKWWPWPSAGSRPLDFFGLSCLSFAREGPQPPGCRPVLVHSPLGIHLRKTWVCAWSFIWPCAGARLHGQNRPPSRYRHRYWCCWSMEPERSGTTALKRNTSIV